MIEDLEAEREEAFLYHRGSTDNRNLSEASDIPNRNE